MRMTVIGCNGPYPGAQEPTSGYLLEEESTRVLLDCGSGVVSQLMAHTDIRRLTAVVLSHLHYDHMSDMLPLLYFCQMNGVRLPVYLPMQPSPVLEMLRGAFDLYDISQGGQLGRLRMRAMPVRHPVPAYAVRMENAAGRSFCYTGDTNTCEGLADFCAGSDLLLADACFPHAQWNENKPHLSAYLAAQLACDAQAGQLILTHFSDGQQAKQCETEGKSVYPGALRAYPGLSVTF